MKIRKNKVEIWQSHTDWQWYWHLRGKNGEIMARGEAHPTKYNAKRAVKAVRRALMFARTVEIK